MRGNFICRVHIIRFLCEFRTHYFYSPLFFPRRALSFICVVGPRRAAWKLCSLRNSLFASARRLGECEYFHHTSIRERIAATERASALCRFVQINRHTRARVAFSLKRKSTCVRSNETIFRSSFFCLLDLLVCMINTLRKIESDVLLLTAVWPPSNARIYRERRPER